MKFILSSYSTISQAPIDSKVVISVFVAFQYSLAKGPVVASHQLGFSSLLAAALYFFKVMDVINYDLFHCPSASPVIFSKINELSNWTRKISSYSQALLFNCYVLQGHLTGILQTLIWLLVIKTHPLLDIFWAIFWQVLRTKSQSIKLMIQPV